MNAIFQFYAIPLNYDGSGKFHVELLCVPVFDPNQSFDQATLDRIVTVDNPLWRATQAGKLNAWIAPYAQWRDAAVRQQSLSGAAGLQTVALKFADGQSGNVLKQRLRRYFGQSATTGEHPANTTREAMTQEMLANHSYSLHHLHQSTQQLGGATKKSLNMALSSDLSAVSLPMLRWVDAATRASVLKAVYSDAAADNDSVHALSQAGMDQAVHVLRDAKDKVQARIKYDKQQAFEGLRGFGQNKPLDPTDPNAAVHAALREPFLARYLGFRTTWISETLALADGAYLLQPTDLYDAGAPQNTPPVVFLHGKTTHPAAFADVAPAQQVPFSASTGLYVQLTRSMDDTYSTTCVDAEAQLLRDVVLQASNSLAAPANQQPPKEDAVSGPQLLKQQSTGATQPTTSGIQFFAAPSDLVPSKPLVQGGSRDAARAAWPCLFLEDLWIGYRLELKRRGDPRFLSIHRQRKVYTLRDGTTAPETGAAVAEWVEDFIDRDQQDAGPGKPASTQFFTYNGFTTEQINQYRIAMGVAGNRPPDQMCSFQSTVVESRASEALIFGLDYDYRLRTVLLGGLGAPPDLGSYAAHDAPQQGFSFLRAHAFRPGELLLQTNGVPNSKSDGAPVYLTPQHPAQSLFLLPSPINLETARYEGLLFQDEGELTDLRDCQIVTDLGVFAQSTQYRSTGYFLEPHVSSVTVRVSLLNGNVRKSARTIEGPGPTLLALRRHVDLPPIEMHFGAAGDWRNFRPIELRFQALGAGDTEPATEVRGQKLTVWVPASGELAISILPKVSDADLMRTAAVAPTAWQYEPGVPAVTAEQVGLPVTAMVETAARVLHAVQEPLLAPQMRPVAAAPRSDPGDPADDSDDDAGTLGPVVVAVRSEATSMATPNVRVDVDAASSKEVYLEAFWSDISIAGVSAAPVQQPGHARSQARSLIFRQVEPYAPDAGAFLHFSGMKLSEGNFTLTMDQQFHCQESEDTVIAIAPASSVVPVHPAGAPPPPAPAAPAPATNAAAPPRPALAIDFGDARRKWGTVQAVAVSRFAAQFNGLPGSTELRSPPQPLDVPSAILLQAPQIHSMRHLKSIETVNGTTTVQRRSTFALRFYLPGIPFASGIGQRVALGFAAGAFTPFDPQTHELINYASMWGEDPMARPHLAVSRRFPRASDFASPYADADAAGLDPGCYPAAAVAGNRPVIYRDDLLVGLTATSPGHYVSIASYALIFDSAQQLWYFDVVTATGFRGWMRLALYSHQPHSMEDLQLSLTTSCVYVSSLGDELMTWRRWMGRIYVSIGPVDDEPHLSYQLDTVTYRNGVSEEMRAAAAAATTVDLTKIHVGHAVYFEGNVEDGKRWNWVKRRYETIVDSGEIGNL